jgi:hypothetical protein
MNPFKDMPSYMNERAKSPFYGSFILSWLIWNWKIVFVVLFFKHEDMGGLNIIDYILLSYVNIWDSLVIPLSVGLVFIFLLPWIDYWILLYSEEMKRKKIDRKIIIGRRHFVEGNTYYDLKLKFEEERKKIMEADKESMKDKSRIAELENKITELDDENSKLDVQHVEDLSSYHELDEKYKKLTQRHDPNNFFNDRWLFECKSGNQNIKHEVEINRNDYIRIENNERTSEFKLALIDLDIDNHTFSFVKFRTSERKPFAMCELRIISNDRLEGTENETVKVTYTRRKFISEKESLIES